ncbi:hypothetical protein GCM10007067_12370 [Lysobacter bugurensis]|uniref:Uncharacterized protein n=1 Tax=Cognatilysobacter bugurensis TaxID=543356 RepID=A0A918SWY6_9GAMM|nr:hypothetical protein GCM10007067_12370 [Lysobacter bugurensis]
MTVRTLAWLNGLGLLAFVMVAVKGSRIPVASYDFVLRYAALVAAGLGFITAAVLISRRAPLAAKILLATPPVVVIAFLLGLLVAAFIAPL